ncbi:MAG: transcription elongation factor GreA [Sphingobacteriales bacterium]|nr:MAG: transcription elongation factor GreA [Sphingobacteriales bacterium]
MMEIKYYTPEGLENLKKELQTLKTTGRSEMSKQIAEAREKGDLSENAEYDAAKEAQGMLERKIAQLEAELAVARILDESKLDISKVAILSKVKLKNLSLNKIMEYMLVTEVEADVKSGKISVNTPIAKGLLGKSVGEVVEVNVPSGTLKFEILEISR